MARSGCLRFLKMWASQRGAKVVPSTAVRDLDLRAPHSELCLHTRCAGKRIRAFAIDKRHGMAAIAYTDGKACHFTSGLDSEVIPVGTHRAVVARGLAGARRQRKRR